VNALKIKLASASEGKRVFVCCIVILRVAVCCSVLQCETVCVAASASGGNREEE